MADSDATPDTGEHSNKEADVVTSLLQTGEWLPGTTQTIDA